MAAMIGFAEYTANPPAPARTISASKPTERMLVILHFSRNELSIPAAMQESPIGKMGRRNLGNPDAKKIPRLDTNQTITAIRHALAFLIARKANGAKANTVGP